MNISVAVEAVNSDIKMSGCVGVEERADLQPSGLEVVKCITLARIEHNGGGLALSTPVAPFGVGLEVHSASPWIGELVCGVLSRVWQ